MSARYKARPITPVDAVKWDGTNLTDIEALCPEVKENGTILLIPTDAGEVEAYVGEIIMRNMGSGKYSKLDADVFFGLYEVQ